MMGNPAGPWHVTQAWRLDEVVDGEPEAAEGISILTIVDDDGTLRVARDLNARYKVRSAD